MLNILKSIFGIQQTPYLNEFDAMKKYLIIGLGNIGTEYVETRHNVGFKIVDELARQEEFKFESARLGEIGRFKIKGKSVLCLKPSTYMNLSGKALRYWMDKEKVPLENILVITDDINLDFGILRLRSKGSNGGHNGLKDVQNVLQTNNYNRLRFGVGAEFSKGRQVDYVLGQWNETEKEQLNTLLQKATEVICSFVQAGVVNTMNQFNGN